MPSKIILLCKSIWHILINKELLIIHKNSIVLRSIPKSGTNYLRLILANYFSNLNGLKVGSKNFIEVDYDKMHFVLFPNIRNEVLTTKSQYIYPINNTLFLDKMGYSDFMYDHGCIVDKYPLSFFFQPKKMILLYRNPLDILISRFYFFYKNRIGSENTYEHPRDLILQYIPQYAKVYSWMKKYSSNNPSAILVSYEELKLFPNKTIKKLLNHLQISIYPDLIDFSIQASSIKKVQAMEQKRGKAIHSTPVGIRGSFVRSGTIGEWEVFFNDDDISNIKNILNNYQIDINEFILKPLKMNNT